VGRVKTGSAEREVLTAWGAEDFLVNATDGTLLLGEPSGLWNWASEVNKNQKGGRGQTRGYQQGGSSWE